jgi:hypothetical protein
VPYRKTTGTVTNSLPYVISFADCEPETSVSMKVYAKLANATATDLTNATFDNNYFTIEGSVSKEMTVT